MERFYGQLQTATGLSANYGYFPLAQYFNIPTEKAETS